ncbi:signal transduction histidine kinase [Kordia periserrulae]|uniref:histidine kinase n=1 Tax=Kordia periserrulae TaxID=701523 RepID=A0A2T6C5W2_9FLAO|nr:sensor histidine kinase [Kordia periserrulae]PTX63694.1 signal transduction histidine kinase [Kordia periserrulae]
MGESDSTLTLQIIIIGMVVLFALALGVIVFFIIYQKRLFAQQQKHQQVEAAYQRELLQIAIQSEEKERSRIGKELHDDVGALLTTTKLYLSQISPEASPEKLQATTEKMYALFERMIQGVRSISQDLRPVILERLGLVEAVKSLVATVNDLKVVQIHFTDKTTQTVSKRNELNVYRILQELLNNTLKHAQATKVSILFANEGTNFTIVYQDDGVGFDESTIQQKKGIGLKNIESRLSALLGTLRYEEVSKGIKLIIQIPITHE